MPSAGRSALRVLTIAGWALLVCLTLPDKSPSLLLRWPWPVFHQLLLALPAVWIAISVAANPNARHGLSRPAAWMLALLATATIASALFSPFQQKSLEWLPVRIAPLFLIAAVARAVAADETGGVGRKVAGTIAATLAGLCFISFLWWFAADFVGGWQRASAAGRDLPLLHFLQARNQHPLGHSNYTAGVAVLAIGWTGCMAAREAGSRRSAWIFGSVISAITLFTSGSRGGWVGLGVLLLAAAFVVMRRRRMPTARIVLALAAVGIVAIGLAMLHPRARAMLMNRDASGALAESDVQRYSMAQAAVLMSADRPLLGYGPGTVPLVYPRYRERLEGGVETALQLHSTPLQIVATTGYIGLALGLGLTALVLVRLWRQIGAEQFGVEGSAGLVALGYAAFAWTDYQLDVPLFAAAVASTAALALSSREGPAPRTAATGYMHAAVAILWLIAAVFIEYAPLTVRAKFASAIDALERNQTDIFVRRSMEAIDHPHEDPRLNNVTALILANPQAYGVPMAPDPNAAASLLEQSLAANPDQEIAHFNLGWLLLKSDPVAAMRHFKEAARLVPDKGGVYLGMGLTLLERGETGGAVEAFAVALVNNPRMVSSPIWNAPQLHAHWAPAIARASALLDPLAAAGEDPSHARRARYLAALFRWIAGDDPQLSVATENADPEAMRFLALVPKTPPSSAASMLTQPWTGPDNWRAVLSPADAPALTSLIKRTAYGLVMRDEDLPPPIDLYISTENMQVAQSLPFLFPPKGWLRGPELRRLESNIPE